jgi:divalent metal cation (Fe/Co/Zn/Cd) transporter
LIFRPALGEIMDEDLHEELVEKIRKETVSIDGVVDTEKCHVRKMGMKYLVDLHVIVDGDLSVTQGHTIAHQVKDHLRTNFPEVADILIHIEPN